jgi:hypothetical protein
MERRRPRSTRGPDPWARPITRATSGPWRAHCEGRGRGTPAKTATGPTYWRDRHPETTMADVAAIGCPNGPDPCHNRPRGSTLPSPTLRPAITDPGCRSCQYRAPPSPRWPVTHAWAAMVLPRAPQGPRRRAGEHRSERTRKCVGEERSPRWPATRAWGLAMRAAGRCERRRRGAPERAHSQVRKRGADPATHDRAVLRRADVTATYPFTPPMARPPMMYFWRNRYTIDTGSANMIAKALNSDHGVWVEY